jgi:glycosyltransferase involved in cell wall biosynthesis
MVVDTPVKKNFSNPSWLRAKLSFPLSDVIIGNSNAGLAAYGASLKKSHCIYNGIDLSRFEHLKDKSALRKEIFGNPSSEIFVVGMVAAFEERKDYKTLIKAAISLATKDCMRFVLVGNGKNLANIKRSIPAVLSDRIILTGKRSDVESIIQVFDVGILLTNTKVHGEGISNSIIEYMASAKPVIATRGGGTDEVVIDHETGYLIDPEDEGQLIEKIEMLMKDRVLMREMGKNGYRIVKSKFDLKIMMQNYISVYKELLK